MSGINLYSSNRLERLSDKLRETLQKSLSSPFVKEVIAVQSLGMERWLSMRLAGSLGIWANCRYPFLNEIINDLFKAVIPDAGDTGFNNKDDMAWRIMRLLKDCAGKKEFAQLKNYLKGDSPDIKQYQLASRIADVFDQYMFFRTDMLLSWEEKGDKGWQCGLWRLLSSGTSLKHRARLHSEFIERIKSGDRSLYADIPERLSVFGIPSLPEFYLEAFKAASELIDINIFLLNPSREYWADIKTTREIFKIRERDRQKVDSPDKLYLEKGNSLLASMGKLGRDFLWMLLDHDIDDFPDAGAEDPGEDTLLHAIQSDIFNMVDRGAPGSEKTVTELREERILSDRSIIINSCHGPTRELEVLHDYLIDLFNSDIDLLPGDIIVMTPDIEGYAPYIQAVFGPAPDENLRIPFSIADRSIRSDNRIVRTFMSLLELATGRFSAGAVLDILECDEVAQKFKIFPADILLIRSWIAETRIAWGKNAESRGAMGLPEFRENTWDAGIERLLLGYAMPGDGDKLFMDILPFDYIEGGAAPVLGRFLEFYSALTSKLGPLNTLMDLDAWSDALNEMLGALFVQNEETGEDINFLRRVINNLKSIRDRSGFSDGLGIAVIRSVIEEACTKAVSSGQFITGGATFCAMLPMRSIPFKIICLIGMNDSVFPRPNKSSGFDLIAQNPRRGDRSLRDEDRYLFLESIISAREKLYISYTGQGIQDNSTIPPSVLVSELLDYIEQGFYVPGKNIKDLLVTRHRLQAFSDKYYDKSNGLYSYSLSNLKAAQALIGKRRPPEAFLKSDLPAVPEERNGIISVEELLAFFDNPARFTLNKRFGIKLFESPDVLEETEPFDLSGLNKYALGWDLLEYRLAGKDASSLYNIKRAAGALPHGYIGEHAFKGAKQEIDVFARRLEPYIKSGERTQEEIALEILSYRITGQIKDIYGDYLLRRRNTDIGAKDRLRAWILHLILNTGCGSPASKTTILAGRDKILKMEPLKESADYLKSLIGYYRQGLSGVPRFFPESSYAYALAISKKMPHESALMEAAGKWRGSDYKKPEGAQPYFNLCFGRVNPFNEDFARHSLEIFLPVIQNQAELDENI